MERGINNTKKKKIHFDKNEYMIPKNWNFCKLEDCLEKKLRNGIYKPSIFFDKGNAKIIELDSLYSSENEIDKNSLRKIELTAEEISKYGLRDGDIIINRVSKKPEGIAAARIIKIASDFKIPLVFESNMIKASVDNSKILPEFFNLYTQTIQYEEQVKNLSLTNNQTSINQPALLSVFVPLPSKNEQKQIINLLYSIDEFIRRKRSYINLNHKLKNTLLGKLLTYH